MKRSEVLEAAAPFLAEAQRLRVEQAKAVEAGDDEKAKSLAGKLSGVQRRWARRLVEMLTEEVIGDRSRSREKVRDWQQETFGQAVASQRLKAHATPERDGGGRSKFSQPPAAVSEAAGAFFKAHRRLLGDWSRSS